MKKVFYIIFALLINIVINAKHFVLISAPGSGKGTCSQYLIEKYGYIQVCPGDIFRSEILAQTDLGKKIQPIVDRGDYVDEEIVCELIASHLLSILDQGKNFIIDGFPRSLESFNFLHKFFQEKKLIKDVRFLQFIANDTVCVERIVERQVCTSCFKVYHLTLARPKEYGACDSCRHQLSFRKADTQEISKSRLAYFHANIEPLISIAEQYYIVQKIDTQCSLEELRNQYDQLI